MNWKQLLTSLNPGMSQCKIARKYGVDQSGMGRIFRGLYQPSIASLTEWARVEGISTWELIKLAEECSTPQ